MLVSALVLLAWARPADAARPSALVVFGRAEPRLQGIVMGVVDRVLRQAGWPLVPTLSDSDAGLVRGCLNKESPWPCVRSMADKKGIQQIIAVRVELERLANGTSQIVLTGRLVYAGSSSVLEQKRYCAACSDDDLVVYAEEISKLLLDERAVKAGTTNVEVTSEPLGAEVRIDGQVVGITNNTFPTYPGKHAVEVQLAGHEPETRSVTAIDGKTVTTAVTLRLLGAPAPAEEPVSPASSSPDGRSAMRRYAPLAMVGVGGVLMVTGGVLWAMDENMTTYKTTKDFEMDPTFTDTAPVAVPMLIGGAVIAGVGGYLWWKYRSKNSTPIASASSDGALVGLVGSF